MLRFALLSARFGEWSSTLTLAGWFALGIYLYRPYGSCAVAIYAALFDGLLALLLAFYCDHFAALAVPPSDPDDVKGA